MTAALSPQNHNRWLRAVGYGLLAEICTIITIIIVATIYKYGVARGLAPEAYDAFGQKAGGAIGIVGGTLFTFVFARFLMRGLSANFITHGSVVAGVAIAVSVLGSVAGHQGVPLGYVLASILKLLAGWFAGFQAGRRQPLVNL